MWGDISHVCPASHPQTLTRVNTSGRVTHHHKVERVLRRVMSVVLQCLGDSHASSSSLNHPRCDCLPLGAIRLSGKQQLSQSVAFAVNGVDVKSVTVSQDDGRKTVSEQSVQRITSKETAQT